MGDPTSSQRLQQELQERLAALPFYQPIRQATADTGCHFVGGALRDLALGVGPTDIDLTLAHNGLAVAQSLASLLSGTLVHLGGERFASYRVVAATDTIDIWDRQGTTIEHDLKRRDFTMHSFAVEASTGNFVDPLGGFNDLRHRRLVATSSTTFSSDPVRILRLCRLASQIEELQITATTMELAFQARLGIHRVATERIDSELNRLLSCVDTWPGVQSMITTGLFPRVLLSKPTQGPIETRGTTRDLRRMLEFADHVAARLPCPVERILVRLAVLILASRPHDPSVPIELDGDPRYRIPISQRQRSLLERLLRPSQLPTDHRDQRWFIHRSGLLWPTALCVAAVRHSTCQSGESTLRLVKQLADLAVRDADDLLSPRFFLSGDDLKSLLGLAAGEELGKILRQVHRRQVEGELATKSQAIALARRLAGQADELG